MPTRYDDIKQRKETDQEYADRLKSYAKKYKAENLDKEKDRQRESKRKSREKDRDAYNAYMRDWARKNAESINAKRRERRKSDPNRAKLDNERRKSRHDPIKRRDEMLKTKYGITADDYYKMYIAQGGKCAICLDSKPNEGRSGLVVDHCHENGSVRKLLCSHCNTGLGQFRDSVDLLEKAIKYLKG